jgi:uncharacterized OsmC-like protein
MGMKTVADALARLEKVLQRRPDAGMSADPPARACWAGPEDALRVGCRHPNGREVFTDMPAELGGSGDQVSPGWLYRAGLASCATTSIVMLAATEGVELTRLEVESESRSDSRGLVELLDERGISVNPAPVDQRLVVRIAAFGATPTQLDALVHRALRRSPIPRAISVAGLTVQIEEA